jgi:hypothetical protein
MINTQKLAKELVAAGITTHGNCNSNGIVWDDDNREIQTRADVKAILAAHDPTPDPPQKSAEEKIVELQTVIADQAARIVVLSKAADRSKLLPEEVAILESPSSLPFPLFPPL